MKRWFLNTAIVLQEVYTGLMGKRLDGFKHCYCSSESYYPGKKREWGQNLEHVNIVRDLKVIDSKQSEELTMNGPGN